MINRAVTVLLALIAALSLAGPATAIAQGGQVASMQAEDIGLPGDVSEVTPVAINTNGDVLVVGTTDDGPVTFLYRNGSFDRLGGDDTISTGAALNESGDVAGSGESNGRTSAALFEDNHLVFMPGEFESSQANAINAEGMLVGEAIVEAGAELSVPVFWTEIDMIVLPSSGNSAAGSVLGINTISQMVGWSAQDEAASERHATMWVNDEVTVLGTLGGPLSEARAINETGLIVGASTTGPDQASYDSPGSSAFSWFDGQLTDLGLGANHVWAAANGVNNVGMIVGVAGLDETGAAGNDTVAILWTGVEILDLNTIVAGLDGLTLTEAVSVNEFGQILCRAIDDSGNSRIVVLSVLGN